MPRSKKYFFPLILISCCFISSSVYAQNQVQFESLLLNTEYGPNTGFPCGTNILEEDGVFVSIADFEFADGRTNCGTAQVDPTFPEFSAGEAHVMGIDNINLVFDFTKLGIPVQSLTLDYVDFGGYENISVNGEPLFVGELDAAPTTITRGVSLSVSSNPVTGGKGGTLILTGNVEELIIGGQEFWIDNLEVCACAKPIVLEFESLPVTMEYGPDTGFSCGMDVFNENGVSVAISEFEFTNGITTCNSAQVDPAFKSFIFGKGQVLETNNINLVFDFTKLASGIAFLKLDFADLGGFENISVNGEPLLATELDAAPAAIAPGVQLDVSTSPISGGADKMGRLTLSGNVDQLTIGGQEFWIDNLYLCPVTGVSVEQPAELLKERPLLYQNYPNPFTSSTTISFELPKAEFVTLKIFDLLGREVEELLNHELAPGIHRVTWQPKDVASGAYIYRLEAGAITNVHHLRVFR